MHLAVCSIFLPCIQFRKLIHVSHLDVMGIVANIVFEIVTISLTWAKTISSVRRLRGMDTSLVESITYVVFRDGEYILLILDALPSRILNLLDGVRNIAFHVSYTALRAMI